MSAKKTSKKASKPKKKTSPLSLKEWEKLILSDFDHCPICDKEFSIKIGCRKICKCGYQEGCED
ncbi:hypothetical protein HY229_05505 [Candidatus Acetothermia bacterium]|nr:hypothetical protein [Candidatus Acetothermia bacterium]MBI3643541.1 hypothetical protein [Candidatus Acetothermia bacterium]